MYQGVTNFDATYGNISGWNTSCITNMAYMFASSDFNQDISSWDVSNVTDMAGMFGNSLFNQDISAWDVSSVTDMSYMFQMTTFDQDLSSWNISSVANMVDMFSNSGLSSENYSKILIGWGSLPYVQNNVQLGVSKWGIGVNYSWEAAPYRQNLIDNYSWTINDGQMIFPIVVSLTNPSSGQVFNPTEQEAVQLNFTVESETTIDTMRLYLNNMYVQDLTGNDTVNLSEYYGHQLLSIVVNDTNGNSLTTSIRITLEKHVNSISTCGELNGISVALNESFILTNDIDCSGYAFEPIGYNAEDDFDNFVGLIDGKGHTISNLHIDNSRSGVIGFTGFISTLGSAGSANEYGVIRNITFDNFTVISLGNKLNTGLIARALSHSLILDVHVTNSYIEGDGLTIGGLVASNSDGYVARSSVTGSIITTTEGTEDTVGGLTGSCSGTVIDSYVNDTVVTGDRSVGGLIGRVLSGAQVINCWASANATGNTAYDGALCGGTNAPAVDDGNFFDNQVSATNDTQCGIGKTTAEMYDNTTFISAGWDYDNVWSQVNGTDYPYHLGTYNEVFLEIMRFSSFMFANQEQNVTVFATSNNPIDTLCVERSDTLWSECYDMSGLNELTFTLPAQGVDGLYVMNFTVNDTVGDTDIESLNLSLFPTEVQYITTCDEFFNRTEVGGNYALANNLDCSYINRLDGAVQFVDGDFDGQGYTIGNLTLNCDGGDASCGLFRLLGINQQGNYLPMAVVHDLRIENVVIDGGGSQDNVGALTGKFQYFARAYNITVVNVTISNCDDNVGGLIGLEDVSPSLSETVFSDITVRDVTLTGAGTGSIKYGGFVGYMSGQSSNITNSTVNDVWIQTGSQAGCFAGIMTANVIQTGAENCYVEGTANGCLGGYAGRIVLNVSQSYVKNVTVIHTGSGGADTDIGAFAGQVFVPYNDSMINSYALNVTVNSTSASADNLAGFIGEFLNFDAKFNVMNCYTNAFVDNSSGSPSAPFIGEDSAGNNITNSYYDNQTSGVTTCTGDCGTYPYDHTLASRNTADMQTQSTYIGWDFDNIWTMVSYPELQAEPFTSELPFKSILSDSTPPQITFYAPTNTTYTTSTINLEVSADETTDTWWYSLNGGANTTFTPNTTITATEGQNYIIVYANDSFGNVGNSEVYFTYEIQIYDSDTYIPGGTTGVTTICVPNWVCSNWTECDNGIAYRTCTDENNCGTDEDKPAENTTCIVITNEENETVTLYEAEAIATTGYFLVSGDYMMLFNNVIMAFTGYWMTPTGTILDIFLMKWVIGLATLIGLVWIGKTVFTLRGIKNLMWAVISIFVAILVVLLVPSI